MRTKRVLGIILTPPRYVLWGLFDWMGCQTFNYDFGPRLAFLVFFAAFLASLIAILNAAGCQPLLPL